MRKEEREHVLADSLKLRSPRFKPQKIGSKVSGHVTSDTFRGKADNARQQMIWDALESTFGAAAAQQVGTLLAYTNDEWDIDLPAKAG